MFSCIIVLFGPMLAAMCKQCAIPVAQKAGKQRSLFHFATAALPGCGFGYTSVRLLRSLVSMNLTWKMHWKCNWTPVHDTLVSDTLVSKIEKRGGKREKKRASWVGEKKTSDIGGNK